MDGVGSDLYIWFGNFFKGGFQKPYLGRLTISFSNLRMYNKQAGFHLLTIVD
jgi:hypothetical protein